jgi:hypothetical protein
VYLLSVARLIACKDASLFEAFSCPWTPSSTFYKLLEIERHSLAERYNAFCEGEETCWSPNEFETRRVPSVNGPDRNSCKRIQDESPPQVMWGFHCPCGRHSRKASGVAMPLQRHAFLSIPHTG